MKLLLFLANISDTNVDLFLNDYVSLCKLSFGFTQELRGLV